jgi:hypothetical protein
LNPAAVTSKANSRPGSQVSTTMSVVHDFFWWALVPRKCAPAAGPVAPLAQVPPVFSGDHSPIRGMSLTRLQIRSGGAAISLDSDTVSPMVTPLLVLATSRSGAAAAAGA